ncbi:MAG: anaerobic ribonucleoside-triphosphate reductase activating protein [Dictyoglomaceae bacterium]|nr:anaerobic ribonucleoside-triphosphate reductase activating protein [Dictyoglomaceae bacterium]
MKISGYLGFSLIDFPERISFVIFTQGCNFRCPFCHNPELISTRKKGTYSEEFILEELARRRKLIDSVVITGGEPTLQKDLPKFLFKLKKKRLFIKLDTNGSNPYMLMELIQAKLVDYVALDFKNSKEKYGETIGLKEDLAEKYYKNLMESLKILKKGNINFEVRTTLVPELVREKDLRIIKDIIGDIPYYLQQFNPEKTLNFEYRFQKPYSPEKAKDFREKVQGKLRGIINSS